MYEKAYVPPCASISAGRRGVYWVLLPLRACRPGGPSRERAPNRRKLVLIARPRPVWAQRFAGTTAQRLLPTSSGRCSLDDGGCGLPVAD